MRKRLQVKRIRRGRFEVSVDGAVLGHVVRADEVWTDSFDWWWVEPVHRVVSGNHDVVQNPENPLRWGFRGFPSLAPPVWPIRRRSEAVVILCDMQGLVDPVARALVRHRTVATADEDWIARAIHGFSNVDEYDEFFAVWESRHPAGEL